MKRNITRLLLLTLILLGGGTSVWSQYCSSNFSLTSMGYINNVTFGTINQSSGGTSGGPVNYTTSAGTASVTAGDTYTLSVNNSSGSSLTITAYIDWNQNEVLDDAGEVYTLLTSGSTTGPHTLSIEIPFTALGGDTRMRVMLVYDATPDPCAELTYGEAEDYKINVVSVCSPATELTGSAVEGTSVVLDWEQYGIADEWEIKYGPAGFDPATSGTTVTTDSKPYLLEGLDYATDYDFYIRTTCAETGEMSVWSETGSFTTTCPLPELTSFDDTERCGPGTVTLSATASIGGIIRWYADEEGTDLLGTGSPFTTSSVSETTTFYVSTAFPATPCQTAPVAVIGTVNPLPIVNIGTDTIICTGVSYTLNAGNPGSTYAWSTGATTQTILAEEEGTYTVAVTNSFGCTVSDSRTFFSSADSMVEGFNFVPFFGDKWGSVQFFPLNPSDLVQYYEWDFGDGSPLSNDTFPIHQFETNGHYDVTLTVGNECFRWSISLPISVEVTGIEIATNEDAAIVLYPNPARDVLLLENKSTNNPFQQLSIYDITGRMIYHLPSIQNNKISIPTENLSSGIYSVRINTSKGLTVRKFEIMK